MKRLALRSTAALLSIAVLGTTASAQSGYAVAWGKADAASATSSTTDRASSGYAVAWGKQAQTERASSGYAVAWGKAAE